MGDHDMGHLVQLFLIKHGLDALPCLAMATIGVQNSKLAQGRGETREVVGTYLDLGLDPVGERCPAHLLELGQLFQRPLQHENSRGGLPQIVGSVFDASHQAGNGLGRLNRQSDEGDHAGSTTDNVHVGFGE